MLHITEISQEWICCVYSEKEWTNTIPLPHMLSFLQSKDYAIACMREDHNCALENMKMSPQVMSFNSWFKVQISHEANLELRHMFKRISSLIGGWVLTENEFYFLRGLKRKDERDLLRCCRTTQDNKRRGWTIACACKIRIMVSALVATFRRSHFLPGLSGRQHSHCLLLAGCRSSQAPSQQLVPCQKS